MAFLASYLICASSKADLLIYHFNVGQGDSTLFVDIDSSRSLLVDAGNRGYGKYLLAPVLRRLGLSEINYFVATHYDSDHIGGFDELIANGVEFTTAVFDRGEYTDRKQKTNNENYTQYGEYVAAANRIGRKTLSLKKLSASGSGSTPSNAFDLGQTTVEVIAVGGQYLDENCDQQSREIADSRDNALSIALVVRHDLFSYFIGGDLTGGGNGTVPMEELIAECVGEVSVLKINHHGSATSSSKKFLKALSPKVAVISVGNGGHNLIYRLPRQSVLDDIASLEPRPLLFLTNKGEGGNYEGSCIEDRHIIIHTNGRGYTINGIVRSLDESLERHLKENVKTDDRDAMIGC